MNVVSFCVWGNGTAYYYGVLDNALFINEKLPTFQTWIYHNDTMPTIIKDCLSKIPRVKLINQDVDNNKKNLLWRFLPAFDENVNICLVRDADSRIKEKEITAVLEWIKSDKDFHIMRDSSWHKSKILAGMWGARNKILLPYKDKIIDYLNNNEFKNDNRTDELFLEKYIYPHVVEKSLIHASYNKYESHAKNFTFNNLKIDVGKIDHSTIWIKKFYPNLIIPKLFKTKL